MFKSFLTDKKITKEELAEILDIDIRTLHRWCSGATPNIFKCLKMAKVLKCDIEDLLDNESEYPFFRLGKMRHVDIKALRAEMNGAVHRLTSGDRRYIVDIFRNKRYFYKKEEVDMLIPLAVYLTNLFSRISYIFDKEHINELIDFDAYDPPSKYVYLAIDLFHENEGLLRCHEINIFIKLVCKRVVEVSENPLYYMILKDNLIGIYLQYYLQTKKKHYVFNPYILCEALLLYLISCSQNKNIEALI